MGVHAVIGEAVRTVRPPKALCGRCFCSVRGRLLLTAEEATQHCECTDTDAHGDNSHQRHEESFKSHKIVFHALNLPQTRPERAQNQRQKHSGQHDSQQAYALPGTSKILAPQNPGRCPIIAS